MSNFRNSNIKGKKRCAVGLSGGVDSSVAAYLLKEKGYDVTGVFIQCWDAKADGCKADEDRASAVAVSSRLGIKFEHLDYIKQYESKVIDYFYKEYEAGRTPNPDTLCNKEIKFGLFFDWAMNHGFDCVATGHYARVKCKGGVNYLLRGRDSKKDQSYFLYLLGQKHLSRTLFPLGVLKKAEVRETAKKAGLSTYNRPDSMGICFIGEVDIKDFLKKRISEKAGDVVLANGDIVGKHEGVWFYTIGQRHGFKVNRYFGVPMYIVGKNVDKNELIVGPEKDAYTSKFNVSGAHWISGVPARLRGPACAGRPSDGFDCQVRIRHLGEFYRAHLNLESDKSMNVSLQEPAFAVTPGQIAVFYDKDIVLGGGIIEGSVSEN